MTPSTTDVVQLSVLPSSQSLNHPIILRLLIIVQKSCTRKGDHDNLLPQFTSRARLEESQKGRMKVAAAAAAAAAILLYQCTAAVAFTIQDRKGHRLSSLPPSPSLVRFGNDDRQQQHGVVLSAAVELEPEPEGGMELTARKSMPDCRMKRLRQLDIRPSKNDEGGGGGEAYEFWMTAVAEGELIKSIRAQILKDASKKANFPGFRKGQVPPYALPQIAQFAVQEGIIKTVEAAVEAFGLQSIDGSDGQVTVHEDVAAMAKGYQQGQSLPFTATFNATMAAPIEAEVDPTESNNDDDAAAATVVLDVDSVAMAED